MAILGIEGMGLFAAPPPPSDCGHRVSPFGPNSVISVVHLFPSASVKGMLCAEAAGMNASQTKPGNATEMASRRIVEPPEEPRPFPATEKLSDPLIACPQ